jgi:hypothetical protein
MFEIGEKVRIKSWEQMEQEFGLDRYDDINCSGIFVKDMKYLCGQEITIEEINGDSIQDVDWNITFDMIEKI